MARGTAAVATTGGLFLVVSLVGLSTSQVVVAREQMDKIEFNRRAIVFDIKTPKVFYCPQEKQHDISKMIVKAKPLDKLCEFDGGQKPEHSPSDCFDDIDETEIACDEKKRFLLRLEYELEESDEPKLRAKQLLDDSVSSRQKPQHKHEQVPRITVKKGLATVKKV